MLASLRADPSAASVVVFNRVIVELLQAATLFRGQYEVRVTATVHV
jgi:hypothetical protein